MHEHPAAAAIKRQRVVAVIRAGRADVALQAGRALLDAGLCAVEVSLTTNGALEVLAELAENLPSGAVVGAGTVLDADDVRAAAAAGATFVVAPNVCATVVTEAHEHEMAAVPAAATPTEIVAARRCGADLIKLFPASLWTPDVLGDVRAAMPWLESVPTGGVSVEAAPDWIRAGAVAVGMGSALTAGSPTTIARRAGELLTALADATGSATVP